MDVNLSKHFKVSNINLYLRGIWWNWVFEKWFCGIIDAGFKESLPGHVKAPAVFRCHRVTAIGNGEGEFAYLATVHISGHVFKGFLYDHGVGEKNAMPCVSELQLGNNNCSGRKNGECSSAIGINNNNNNAYPASASWRFLIRYKIWLRFQG